MIHKCLVPGMVDCRYFDDCNKRSYDNCTRCKQNKIVVEKNNREKEKSNWFKKI